MSFNGCVCVSQHQMLHTLTGSRQCFTWRTTWRCGEERRSPAALLWSPMRKTLWVFPRRLTTAGCFLVSVWLWSRRQLHSSDFQTNKDRFYCWPGSVLLLHHPRGRRSRARFLLLSNRNSLCLLNTMCCCRVELENVGALSFFSHSLRSVCSLPHSLTSTSLVCLPLDLQRDLDFTFELDFKGQLCEAAIAHDYKMR